MPTNIKDFCVKHEDFLEGKVLELITSDPKSVKYLQYDLNTVTSKNISQSPVGLAIAEACVLLVKKRSSSSWQRSFMSVETKDKVRFINEARTFSTAVIERHLAKQQAQTQADDAVVPPEMHSSMTLHEPVADFEFQPHEPDDFEPECEFVEYEFLDDDDELEEQAR